MTTLAQPCILNVHVDDVARQEGMMGVTYVCARAIMVACTVSYKRARKIRRPGRRVRGQGGAFA